MGDIKIKIPEEVERDFRRAAMETYGYSKGSISKAAQRAIEDWMMSQIRIEVVDDPVGAILGLMKNVRKSSLKLQREAWNNVN